MLRRQKHTQSGLAELDMTPMIDVVFQLIIFFIVTINLEQHYKEDIILEDGKHAPLVKEEPMTMVIEVDRHGWLSMHGAQVSPPQLKSIVRRRYNYMGEFPVLIRAAALCARARCVSTQQLLWTKPISHWVRCA